jgi:hypothetical protein
MLNINRDSSHPCLFLDLGGNISAFSMKKLLLRVSCFVGILCIKNSDKKKDVSGQKEEIINTN